MILRFSLKTKFSVKKSDERKVNDITTGRIYKKRTNPLPVSAPNESKVSATVKSAESCMTSANMEETDSTMEERAQDNLVLLESSKQQEGSSSTKTYEKEQVLEVEFSVVLTNLSKPNKSSACSLIKKNSFRQLSCLQSKESLAKLI